MKKNFLKLFIILIIIIIVSIFVLTLFNNKVTPVYINYAEGEMKRLVTTVINKSISEKLTNEFASQDLFIIKNDSNSNMTMVDFDPVILNRFISSISDIVYENIKLISEKDKDILKKYNVSDSIFYIPSGIIFDSPLLNNLGPRIPINMEIISSVNPNLETKVTEYGINNSLVEVFVNINASIKMILPMSSKDITITVIVPVAVKLIQGMVPDYYLGGLIENNKSSS